MEYSWENRHFFLAVDLTAGRVFSKKGDGNHKNGDIYWEPWNIWICKSSSSDIARHRGYSAKKGIYGTIEHGKSQRIKNGVCETTTHGIQTIEKREVAHKPSTTRQKTLVTYAWWSRFFFSMFWVPDLGTLGTP